MRVWGAIGAAILLLTWAGGAQARTGATATSPAATTHSTAGTSGAATTGTGRIQQFKTEAEAHSACGSGQVAWANTKSRVLHDPGSQYFGKTTHGAYVCKDAALHAGYHSAGQKAPSKS